MKLVKLAIKTAKIRKNNKVTTMTNGYRNPEMVTKRLVSGRKNSEGI